MEKSELISILHENLFRIGFTRKGSSWVDNSGPVKKMVKIEKSNFGNCFFISYGYILKGIPLNGPMHLYYRVSSGNARERLEIEQLLDFEYEMNDTERISRVRTLISDILVPKLQSIKTEADLTAYLKSLPHLNAVPAAIKDHLKLT